MKKEVSKAPESDLSVREDLKSWVFKNHERNLHIFIKAIVDRALQDSGVKDIVLETSRSHEHFGKTMDSLFKLFDDVTPEKIGLLPISSNQLAANSNESDKGEVKGCGVCGSEQVYIRGKYPKTEKRLICPTCTYERLEQIQEISSESYGKTYQSIPKHKNKIQ